MIQSLLLWLDITCGTVPVSGETILFKCTLSFISYIVNGLNIFEYYVESLHDVGVCKTKQ